MEETIGETVYHWTNVTTDFADICRQLPLGEVVRDQDFSLFEAMTALELMDPKMDGGMSIKNHFHEQQQGNRTLTLKQLAERNLLKIRQFSSIELVHLFDQLLSTFHMWLDGHSLALTLYTCVYIHDLTLVEDLHLRTISLTLIKLIDYIRERILLKAGLFEEEDFSGTLTYNFPFYRDLIKDHQCLSDLKKSEDDLNKRLRSLKHQTDVDPFELNSTQQMIYRIKFLRLFYCLIFKYNEVNEKTGEQTYLNGEEIEKFLKQIGEILQLIRPSHVVVDSSESIEENLFPIDSTFLKEISRAFDPYYNYRQLPPAFNRFIRQLIVPSSVYRQLETICDQLRHLLDINEKRTIKQAFEFFLEYSIQEKPSLFIRSLLLLSYLPSAQGCLLSSRKLFGQISFAEQVKFDIRRFIIPPLLTLKHLSIDQETMSYAENFFQRSCVPFSNLFYALCNNRARTREKLANLLDEFSVLQDESEKLDQWLHKYLLPQLFQTTLPNFNAQTLILMEKTSYFFQFILHWTLFIMEYYILMGFDLSLYSKRELYDVYFYFAQIILFSHINVYKTSTTILHNTLPFLIQFNQKFSSTSTTTTTTTNKNVMTNPFAQQMFNLIQENHFDDSLSELFSDPNSNSKKNKKKNTNCLPTNYVEQHEQEFLLINGHYSMSTAMHRCLKALERDQRFKFNSNDSNYFLRDEIRYRHRFLPFANLCAPPYISHADFVQIQNSSDNRSTTDLYQDAINNFSQAKIHFENYFNRMTNSNGTASKQNSNSSRTLTIALTSLIDVENYILIAKKNSIVVKLLLSGHKAETKIDFDFSLNAHYPVFKL